MIEGVKLEFGSTNSSASPSTLEVTIKKVDLQAGQMVRNFFILFFLLLLILLTL